MGKKMTKADKYFKWVEDSLDELGPDVEDLTVYALWEINQTLKKLLVTQ